jgi:hypothetical protein
VLANHERFNDHYLIDWDFHGPPTGVGAGVRLRARAPGQKPAELTVIEAEPPVRSAEETVGSGGGRRTRGTYTLAELDGTTTEVRFVLAPISGLRPDRLAPVGVESGPDR